MSTRDGKGEMKDRPPLRYRLRYLWPPHASALHQRLRAAVLAGVLRAHQAVETYERETRIVAHPLLRALLLLDLGGSSVFPLVSYVNAEIFGEMMRRNSATRRTGLPDD